MVNRGKRKNLILELVDRYDYLEQSTANKKLLGNKDYKVYQIERKNYIGSTKICVDVEDLIDTILYIDEVSNSNATGYRSGDRKAKANGAVDMICSLFDESEIPALLEELGKSNYITLTVGQISKNELIKKSVIELTKSNSAFIDTLNL